VEPDFAAHVRRCFGIRKHSTLATLRRDPRLALHCPTEDAPEDDPDSWLGDAKIAGRAVEVSDPEAADQPHRFRLDIDEVVLTTVDGEHLVIQSWHPGRGLEMRRR
jgi:hypothetical protein